MEQTSDLIIIGGGAAGLAAALYASRFKLSVVCIAKEFGGTGNIAHLVDNWIGDPGITGWDLMQKFVNHVKSYDVPMIMGEVSTIKKNTDTFSVAMQDGTRYESRTILFANGMMHRKLGAPGEEQYAGKGVHYCYTCDGPLYKGKVLAVVGGGDAAAQAALFLSEYGTKVFLIVRKAEMRAEPITQAKLKDHPKIEILLSSNVVEISGDEKKVTQLKLDTGKALTVDGLFIEIGHLPLNDLAVKLGVEVNEHGYIKVNREQLTNLPGVFAAGDITDVTRLKQFITSASEGSIAAHGIYNYLQGLQGGYR